MILEQEYFLNRTKDHQLKKMKCKFGFIKIKNFCLGKYNIMKAKKVAHVGRRYSPYNKLNNSLIFKLYQDL